MLEVTTRTGRRYTFADRNRNRAYALADRTGGTVRYVTREDAAAPVSGDDDGYDAYRDARLLAGTWSPYARDRRA